MNKWQRYAGQACLYGILLAAIGYFSHAPSYVQVPEGMATVKVSVKHSGEIVGACKILSEEELQKLPPNMRQAKVCPRERSPVEFQFLMDQEELYHTVLQPTGLRKDGRANLYRRFTLPEGAHRITVRLKDNIELKDFNYESTKEIHINAGDVLVVKFQPDEGLFSFSL